MASNQCSRHNLAATLVGLREFKNLPITEEHLDEFSPSGVAAVQNIVDQYRTEVLDNENPTSELQINKSETNNKVIDALSGDLVQNAKSIFSELRNPSGILGEEIVGPVSNFITDHHETHYDDIPAGRSEYMRGIQEVYDAIDTSDLNPTQEAYFQKWKGFYTSGGELYNVNARTGIEKAISNVGGNVIKSSPNVILGNVLEATIKLPTLYPKTFLPALGEVIAQNPFKKMPELEEKGIYGIHYAGEDLGVWEGLIGLTDVPLKNLLYTAGELQASGSGAKAVQDGAFTPRFGDLPAAYYTTGGRMAFQFLNYTINTYKMYGQFWKNLATPETRAQGLQQLVTYHSLAGLVGGGAAAGVPALFESIITSAFPDTQDWFDENKNALASLVQPGNITRFGIGLDIASKQLQNIGKSWESAFENFYSGETAAGVFDMAELGLTAMVFSTSPLGDLNIQKGLKIAREAAEGDIYIDEIPSTLFEKYLPSIAKAL